MADWKKEILGVIEQAYDVRLRPRLEGMTDEEYLWEPVPDCWTVHKNDDGTFRADWGGIFDEIPPFTTIAWRMCHLIDCYGSRRMPTWLGIEARPSPLERGMPGTAADAISALEEAHALYVSYISETPEDAIWTKIGPIGQVYAEETKLALILHQLDEIVHHGAEVALMRDLYRAQHRNEDPFVLACLRADRAAIDEMRTKDPTVIGRMIEKHPGLMLRAAETGRLDAIPLLVELGFPVDGPKGRGPIHHAAGVGDTALVKLLIESGADLDAKDPVYSATPLGWAEYFGQTKMVEFLRSLEASARS